MESQTTNTVIDLHTHSIYSDGFLSPQEILDLAQKKFIKVIALTDHDTVLGLQKMLKLDCRDIKIIRGMELGSCWSEKKKSIHILGYNLTEDLEIVQKKTEGIRKYKADRNLEMMEKIKSFHQDVSMEELLVSVGETAQVENITKAHFARYLEKKNIVKNYQQAKDEYFAKNIGKAYVSGKNITSEEAIELIHQFGGKAFIAHPKLLNLENDELDALVKKLKDVGLDGLEIFHYSTKKYADTYFLKNLTQKYNLLYSAGSDFHGNPKRDVHLGQIKQDDGVKKLIMQDVSVWFDEISKNPF